MADDGFDLIFQVLQAYLPSFQVSKSDFEHPSSNFVITLYGTIINKIIEETVGDNIQDPSPFTSAINLNDEESSIFSIFGYIYSIYNHLDLGYECFNLTDLYCPSAKRTKLICKTLLMFLDNLLDATESFSEIENRVLQEVACEKEHYNLRNDLQRELSDKASSVGVLKTETDGLLLERAALSKQESDLMSEFEEVKKNLLQDQAVLNKKMEMLTVEEEEVLKLEKEQAMLQAEVVSSEEVDNLMKSVEEHQNHICQLDEQILGFEDCLEYKKSELNAYEEVCLMLDKLQHTEIPELEKLHKLRLNVKDLEEQIASADKNLLEVKATIVKQKEKAKQQKKDLKERELANAKAKADLSSQLRQLEKKKKKKEKLIVHLQKEEEILLEQRRSVEKSLEKINKDYEEMHEQFQQACDDIIISTNNTTETVRKILTEIENRVHHVHGNKKL